MATLAQRSRRAIRRLYLDAAPFARRTDNELIEAVIRRAVRPDSSCIDVGAHGGGQFLRAMIRCAPQGKHLAVEPLPWMAERLRERFPEVTVHEVALGDTQGTTQFHFLPAHPGRSSMRHRAGWGDQEVRVFDVPLTTLDTLAADGDYALIKIDVEGAQYQVLSGARDTLQRCRPVVVFEHGRQAEVDYGTTSAMIYDVFADCGMALQGLEGFLDDEPPFRSTTFADAVVTSHRHNFVGYPRP